MSTRSSIWLGESDGNSVHMYWELAEREIENGRMTGAPVYIVHLSCNEALDKVREARDRGLPVYAETCPQYLYLSLDNFEAPGFEGAKYVFTPPLREKWHQEKLWNGLKTDHLQVVSTDHCPFCLKEQKELGRDDFTLYFGCADVDEAYKDLRARWPGVKEPKTASYGMRQMYITDPDGFSLALTANDRLATRIGYWALRAR